MKNDVCEKEGGKPLWSFIEPNLNKVKSIARSVAAIAGSVSRRDAEDLASEAILRILEVAERCELTFESDKRYLAWVRGVLRNVAHERYKKNRLTFAELPSDAANISDPLDWAADAHDTEEILFAIAGLGQRYRAVMELLILGLKLPEIASMLGITYETAKKRSMRARIKLRRLLTDSALE